MMELIETQKLLLNILKEIDQVCNRNEIPYYLVEGSMIGAIRHRGFIPWDDDIDIAIPRPYYDKFLEVANNEFPSHLTAVSYRGSSSYIYSFIKVEDNRTKIEFSWTKGCGLIERLYVDVFVLDGTPKNNFWRRCYCYYVQRLIAFKGALFMNLDQRSPIKKLLSKVFLCLISIKKPILIAFIDKQMYRYDFFHSDYVVNYNGVYGTKEITHKRILGKPTLYQFENAEFYGVENFHVYLKNLYGDYMRVPPLKERTNHSLEVTLE